jgi:hypothetical protein
MMQDATFIKFNIIAIILLVVFYGAVRNDFEAGNIHYKGHYKGWDLKSRLFWALKWQRAPQVSFGPKNDHPTLPPRYVK